MKRLNLIIPIAFFVLVLSAVGCGGKVAPAPDIDATVEAAVAATRTASDVQEKVAATLRAPTPTTAAVTRENHYNKGVDYLEAGQYENAIQEFGKAIQLDPDYAWAYINRGSSYANLANTKLPSTTTPRPSRLTLNFSLPTTTGVKLTY